MVDQVVNLPVKLEVKFPLPDGRMLVQGPLTYNTDGLASQHNSEFMRDPRFAKAYAFGMTDGPRGRHLEWRVHVALWLAEQSVQLGGDFIECGVNTGIMSGAIMTYLDFAGTPIGVSTFWIPSRAFRRSRSPKPNARSASET